LQREEEALHVLQRQREQQQEESAKKKRDEELRRRQQQDAAVKKQKEELRRQRENEESERRRQEEVAKKEREAEQKRLETEKKKELAQKKQEAEQAAKRKEQLTRQQEMETLTQLEKWYSSKFKTRASLDRELKRLQDLVNDAKGSFDPALNAEAEIAFVEHQTLLPLCQSPKYASVTDLGIKIASLEERIMKMQIGKERTKAAKELHELKQRLNCEQRDEASNDPNGELICFNLDACYSARIITL
jgi:molybdopterin converting factor small subunit